MESGLFEHYENINSKSLKYNRISDTMFEKQLELDTQIRNLEEKNITFIQLTKNVNVISISSPI